MTQRVIPARANAMGNDFSCPGLDEAVHDLLRQPASTAGVAR